MSAFLLEVGLEEIPADMIAPAQAELEKRLRELLLRERLATENLAVKSFSTLRRLAVLAEGLLEKQVEMEEQVVGPSVAVAYKNGAPTPAAIAFAKKSGVEVGALETIQNAKGEYVAATVRRPGRGAGDVLTSLLPAEIGGLYWPKSMYWRAGKPERFVRPLRWLVALLDQEVLPLEFAGIRADALTYGHRVLHGEEPVTIPKPREYPEKLRAVYVEVDPEARRHRIRKALDAATRQIPGARWREDEPLVETVTHLTEWPNVILGSFDASYLTLPEEVLVTVMRDHQKYFALEDANGKLLPNFLAVLNIEVDTAGAAIIRHGNERVLRARFNDARFFWDVDQKIPLIDRVEMLKNVTFQKEIGSYWDKTTANLDAARQINAALENPGDGKSLDQAVKLAKTDLTTEMVKEFTELQGIVGGLYARQQGMSGEVADAIYEHYRPQGAADEIPHTQLGAVVSLADKMSTITAMFRKGMIPTGSKDPFALRRAGAGVVRILAENAAVRDQLHLVTVVNAGCSTGECPERSTILDFMLDRLEFYLQETGGARLHVARAVRNSRAAGENGESKEKLVGYKHIAGFAGALNQQIGSANVLAVAELLKRTSNILRQAREKNIKHPSAEVASLLTESAELALSQAVTEAEGRIQKNYRGGDYNEVIAAIAALQQPLNAFFDSVMVMVEDVPVRDNRLALLARTESVVRWAADFSELASIQQEN
ncbi:MAG TPA: glycine--tRNA ligase subunit beta [Acidobacteriaceae bacterium]|nr:glycine--tRNA ligase subunit beta [Acidobacteriaceae bacterium]